MKVLKFPMAKISIGFVIGIGIAHYLKPTLGDVIIILSILVILLIVLFFLSKKRQNLRPYFGITAVLLSIVGGMVCLGIQNEGLNKKHYLHCIQDKNYHCYLSLTVLEQIKSTPKNSRYIVAVHQINHRNCIGKALLNIAKDTALKRWNCGSMLLVEGSFYKNKKTSNPNQFDYKAYLENQQIYAQIFTSKQHLLTTATEDRSLPYYTSRLRNSIIANLEQHHFKTKELNIVIALILGQQQEIDPELVKDYQYAGAIHILSVSGLHVACILFFIQFLLQPIPNHRKGSFIKLTIILLSLWLFGLMAGMAPSVLRSVTMFSFMAIGLYLKRTVNFYHTLLVSIFLILLFEPSFLFEIGFQLSYLALFFIVWLQPLLASLWKPNNKIANYFWGLLTVSFAAQLGTFPLSLYYFHQFPGLFFITNLLILPLLTLILGIALFVVVLSAFNWVPYYPMVALEWSIMGLNSIISWVASFERFILKDIPFNIPLMLSSYLLIIAAILFAKEPKYKRLIYALVALLFFQTTLIYNQYNSKRKKEWIVYDCKGKTLISARENGGVIVYSSESFNKNSKEELLIKPYVIANFCKIKSKQRLRNFYYYKNKKIMLINGKSNYLIHQKADIVILSQSPRINLERLLQNWKPQLIIVDGSSYTSYKRRWKATALKEKIPFHDTSEKGFYKL